MEVHAHRKRRRSSSDNPTASGSDLTQRPLKRNKIEDTCLSTGASTGRYVTIHRVYCSRTHEHHGGHISSAFFLDVPALPMEASDTTPLHGEERLLDIGGYLAGWEGFIFVVYLDYDCEAYREAINDACVSFATLSTPNHVGMKHEYPPVEAVSERLQLSGSLQEAICTIRHQDEDGPQNWNFDEELIYPYTKLYRCKHHSLESMITALESRQQLELGQLFHYLTDRLTPEYEKLAKMSAEGIVSQKYWVMLFRQNDIALRIQDGQYQAFVVKSCRLLDHNTLSMECWTWEYDGNFYREHFTVSSAWPSRSKEVAITQLSVYPIFYAADTIESKLRERGHTFWGCRGRKYVSYDSPLQGIESQIGDLRYMVDMDAYRKFNARGEDSLRPSELADDVVKSDEIPGGSFAILLPATIIGYGFHNKEWTVLRVAHIRDIKWNNSVFESQLVLREDKKELIKALITVHIERGRTPYKTDFIEGKGGGLIILLHGGPGTGKTLTAESVAELLERPLHRVMCGDLGTDAERVEKYLKSELFIRKTWDCVVLLDEADVFLEERTKMDLQRNALVSVFLRVLEYYEGILILTTNRIGTFDEAFKSRIQLALHYPPLDRDGRWGVWRNLVRSLSEAGEDINTQEINNKLDILARHRLNGRQIRNTINTARQLARYKKDSLRYAHIDQAVRVVNEFEKYVTDIHGHDDEEYARDLGLRNDDVSREVD